MFVMDEEKIGVAIKKELSMMPHFMGEFTNSKIIEDYSRLTIYEYLKNYRAFFQYLVANQVVSATNTCEITIDEMRALTMVNLNDYKAYLQQRKPQLSPAAERAESNSYHKPDENKLKKRKNYLSPTTIQRAITALKVLFKWLSESSYNSINKPYLEKNPMLEVKSKSSKETLQSRADKISKYLFLGQETQQYLDFIEIVYPTQISNQALKFYNRDKERDLAINALILYSGLRLSEVINIDVEDLSFDTNKVRVIRKGNKDDVVYIGAAAMTYLDGYFKIRKSKYDPSGSESAFFLAKGKNGVGRMTGSAIEKMVGKYSAAFKIRVSPHKLRHTLATRLYNDTLDLTLTAKQLGHKDTATTTLYTNIANHKTVDALNNL